MDRSLGQPAGGQLSESVYGGLPDVMEIRDSRPFYALSSIGYGTLAWWSSSSLGLGAAGLVVFGSYSLWSLLRFVRPRVRLRISEDGIVDETFWWYSPGLIRWGEIVDFRTTKWGLVQIELVDEDSFLGRLSGLRQFTRVKSMLYGLGPALLVPWVLEGSKRDLLGSLKTRLDAYTLAAVRRGVSLGPGEADPDRR